MKIALFIIAKIWKEPMCPSTDEWIKKNVVYNYMIEYYSVIKTNKILLSTTTSMDQKGIMQSEIPQKEKDKCFFISLIFVMGFPGGASGKEHV